MRKSSFLSLSCLCPVLCLILCLGLLSGCGSKRITGMDTRQEPGAFSSSLLGTKVVCTAVTQLGKPYRSGGHSPGKGFDCSGLVYWAYGQNGVKVPRITVDQARAGQSVARARLQAGDIVVFRSRDSSSGLHTGIYVGKNTFIHSPNRRSKVRYDSLTSPHWSKTYLTGRRIVSPVAGR